MNPRRKGWDWWSEAKLKVLADYAKGFTTAVRGRSGGAICLDLFAGSYENDRRHGPGTFPGSSQIALETQPEFTRLVFFELEGPAARLRADIAAARPGDNRWKVFDGDCNSKLPEALAWLQPVQWAPTFAFLDPRGLQVAWSTVQALADWRRDRKTKVEQWILMPEPALERVLGRRGVNGQRSADRLDRLFGSRDWLPIHQGRRSGALSPDATRAEFVNLYRWRLENDLGYLSTHALQIVNTTGTPVYTLVFATDSAPGDSIMGHLYRSAATKVIPEMQARAQVARQHRREDKLGRMRLPGIDEYELEHAGSRAAPGNYEHTPPWEPEVVTDETLDLEGTPDLDPDDIDWDELDPGDGDEGAP
jgi:three-Cys-motif partner protein